MEQISLLGIMMRGGLLMIPIFLCSLAVVGVAVERWLNYRRVSINPGQFMTRLRHPLSRGDLETASRECSMTPGPVAAVAKAGIEKAKLGRERVREAMEAAGNAETYHLERNLNILATLAGIAPLLGFFGTVTGMIKAFMKIQQLAGNVNADVLAGGIWEAMITTAAGLAVGIPAVILYNHFVSRVKEFIFHMESTGEEVLDLLGGSGAESIPEPSPIPPEPAPDELPSFDDDFFRGRRTRLADNFLDDDRFNPSGGSLS